MFRKPPAKKKKKQNVLDIPHLQKKTTFLIIVPILALILLMETFALGRRRCLLSLCPPVLQYNDLRSPFSLLKM